MVQVSALTFNPRHNRGATEVAMAQEAMFLKNTENFAESFARCGVKYHFAYPITPATDIMKRMAVILPKYGGKMMQMESELAVSSALAGAACSGTLAATSSSGPGMTLMQEAISFMAGAGLPCLMVDSMRVGPGDGDILGAQSDYYMATRGGGHGDYRVPVLAPIGGQEIPDLVPRAIRLAYTYKTPVLFVMDGVTAQTTESVLLPEYHDYSEDYDTTSWAYTGTGEHEKRALITGSYSHKDGYLMNERLRANTRRSERRNSSGNLDRPKTPNLSWWLSASMAACARTLWKKCARRAKRWAAYAPFPCGPSRTKPSKTSPPRSKTSLWWK